MTVNFRLICNQLTFNLTFVPQILAPQEWEFILSWLRITFILFYLFVLSVHGIPSNKLYLMIITESLLVQSLHWPTPVCPFPTLCIPTIDGGGGKRWSGSAVLAVVVCVSRCSRAVWAPKRGTSPRSGNVLGTACVNTLACRVHCTNTSVCSVPIFQCVI